MLKSHPLDPYSISIFTEITALANQHNAINLSQGFPNFEGPKELKDILIEEIKTGWNQYTVSHGIIELREAIAEKYSSFYGLNYCPDTEITIMNGATEALFNTISGIFTRYDEVFVLEPFYDAYIPNLQLIGAKAIPIRLNLKDKSIPFNLINEKITNKSRGIIINSPHNPSGIIFSSSDLEKLSKIAKDNDLIVLSDEVYEHITFDGYKHESISRIDGMKERTVVISSIGKSYSFTGWKIGWTIAEEKLSKKIRSSHQFTSYSSNSALQKAAAAALKLEHSYYDELKQMYTKKRNFLIDGVENCGFKVLKPQGTYFFIAEYSTLSDLNDREFVKQLIQKAGIALIPPSAFYLESYNERNLRFCFCKTDELLEKAVSKLNHFFD